MWILKTCKNKSEANYWECYLAFKYGIPTLVFDTANRLMKFTQKNVDKLFSEIDTVNRAIELMKDLNIDPRFPITDPEELLVTKMVIDKLYISNF